MKIRDSVLKKFGFRIFYEPYPFLFLKITAIYFMLKAANSSVFYRSSGYS